MINSHIHTFNSQYTPKLFIKPYLKNLPDWMVRSLTSLLNTRFGRLGSKLGMGLPGNVQKYASFLNVGLLESQDMVFKKTVDSHPANTKFVVLPLRFEDMGAGTVSVHYEHQLDDLLELKKRYPNSCLPFVFVDSRMEVSSGDGGIIMNFAKKYIEEKGFSGIKLYPSMGYWPFDKRLEKTYQYAQENQIPIMVHCSRGGIYYNTPLNKGTAESLQYYTDPLSFNPQSNRSYHFSYDGNNDTFFENLTDPTNYIDVLEKFPNLKICFAHFGLNEVEAKKINDPTGWYNIIKGFILNPKYPNVYTDISYSLANRDFLSLLKGDLINNPALKERVLYGTDFYMTLQEGLSEAELFQQAARELSPFFSSLANENAIKYLTSSIWEVPPYL